MGKKGDLSDFERGMVVGARRAGLSISETADLLGFSHTTISRVYRELSKKRKYPVNSSSLSENALSMSEVRGEWPGCDGWCMNPNAVQRGTESMKSSLF